MMERKKIGEPEEERGKRGALVYRTEKKALKVNLNSPKISLRKILKNSERIRSLRLILYYGDRTGEMTVKYGIISSLKFDGLKGSEALKALEELLNEDLKEFYPHPSFSPAPSKPVYNNKKDVGGLRSHSMPSARRLILIEDSSSSSDSKGLFDFIEMLKRILDRIFGRSQEV